MATESGKPKSVLTSTKFIPCLGRNLIDLMVTSFFFLYKLEFNKD